MQRRNRGGSIIRTILLMLVALAIGFGAALIAYPHLSFPKIGTPATVAERTTVSENELDMALGTYSYEGKTTSVSVREAIEEATSLEAAKNADGSYNVPSVDNVLAIARNRLLVSDAQARGLSVTKEETAAYAQETMGTTDYAAIAASYGMNAQQAEELMGRSALIKKLRDSVVSTKAPAAPQAPAAPGDGVEDESRPEYGAYIVALLGDEWNGAANTWAREDGPYRAVLSSYTISNDGATYSAAKAAYEVALAQHAAAQKQISAEWTAYVNTILSKVSVQLSSLVA
ncbi:MAG: hypothetical protein Q4B54_08880 [Coriobacteriales bacterium]|nr:hypothetical protein [Coriobacteriales bacterium]